MSKERTNPQTSRVDGLEQEELDIIEYLQKLNNHLIKKNEILVKSCETQKAEISKTEQINSMHFCKIMETLPGGSNQNDTIKKRLNDCLADLSGKLNEIKVGEKDRNEFLSKCRSEFKVRLDADVSMDEYTMMPYHQVEAEIQRVQASTEAVAKKTFEIVQTMNAKVLEHDKEYKEQLQLNDDLEGYLGESKCETEQLNVELRNQCLQHFKQNHRK